MTIKQVFTQVIRDASAGRIRRSDSNLLSSKTIDNWEQIVRNLSPVLGADHRADALSCYNDIVEHLVSRGSSRNYIALCVSSTVSMAHYATRYGIADMRSWQDQRPKIKPERTSKIFLTDAEVDAMNNLDLGNDRRMALARDQWITMYYTGLRISDMLRISHSNINSDTITLVHHKTGKLVVIPVHSRLKPVLTRVMAQPARMGKEELNRRIKTVAKLAGIDGDIVTVITSGGKRVEKLCKKYDMVSCHTARRSVTTNLIRAGISHDIAGDMLGMCSSTWAVYNRMTAEDKAKQLQSTPFFTR